MNFRVISILCAVFMLSVSCGSKPKTTTTQQTTTLEKSKLDITVSYDKQSGFGSNQYAVWVEDANGDLVKTLFVTSFTGDGGYVKRPACTPMWVQKANPQAMTAEQLDTFSGATPSSGNHTYTWDLTDTNGQQVASGLYTFIVEGTLFNDSEVIYEGCVTVGDEEMTVNPTARFTSDNSKNKDMITAVQAKYVP